jgi:hypothetical protein
MLFNSLSFAIFLPFVFGIYWLMAYTPQGYWGVRPDSALAAFGVADRSKLVWLVLGAGIALRLVF